MLVSVKLHSNKYFISSQNSLTARFGDYYNFKLIHTASAQQQNRKTESFQLLKGRNKHISVPACQGMSRRKNEMFFFLVFCLQIILGFARQRFKYRTIRPVCVWQMSLINILSFHVI